MNELIWLIKKPIPKALFHCARPANGVDGANEQVSYYSRLFK
jgi:hypothetical protein